MTALSVVLGILAITYDGFTTTDVDLHDGGVWVTRSSELQVGHLNAQAQELDGGFYSTTADVDLLQDDQEVVLHDRGASTVALVDVAGMASQPPAPIPAGAAIASHGGTTGVLSAEGLLWVMPTSRVGQFNPESMEPVAELGTGAAIAVDREGTLHAASVEQARVFRWVVSDEEPALDGEAARDGLADASALTLTTVGDQPVALDAASQQLFLPGGTVRVPEGSVLQHAGDEADQVVLATAEELIRQPLNGGEAIVERYGEGGDAVRPVQLGGCVYGAWASTRHLVRDCANDANDLDLVVEGADGSPLTFRENRGIVVLNQFQQGNAWLLSDELILVNNWEDLVPPESEEETEEEDESTEEEWQHQPPQLTEENTAPEANDDNDFGARPGRSTILPVLWNDFDQDGDVLTIEVLSAHSDGVVVAPIANDSQLQLQLPPDFAGSSVTIDYRVHDGRGKYDDATARVAVRGSAQNSPPEPLRDQAFSVEQRASFEINLLQDWFDPDGDDLVLIKAESESGDTVEVSPNGRIIYTATGEPGETTLALTVGDGSSEAQSDVAVTVVERGEGTPIANADFVATVEGREAIVEPLLNDFAPGGGTLALAQATSLNSALVIESDTTAGTIKVKSGPVGSYYIQYTLVAGGASAFGVIRVDIREPVEDAAPVAVRDVALLPRGGETLVDLIENDVDPAGGLLVVQSVQVEDAARVTVQLQERRLLRLVDNRGLEGSVTLSYVVSNGSRTDTGTVVVTLVEPPEQPRPPAAVDDTATLREGDYMTVDVMDNDFSPDNTPFHISRIVESSLSGPAAGVAFVADDKLRVHVLEDGPAAVTLTYEIVDDTGQTATATLAVTVVPRDPEVNDPPTPRVVESRVLAGERVRIPIPLDGIDRNGDGVQLVRWETAPSTGRIVETLPDAFVFEADPSSQGTVTFSYRVRDRWGADGTSTVVVGIAQPGEINNPPFAETDEIVVRPDRLLAVPVLANDSDPDEDALSLLTDGLELAGGIDEATVGERNTVDFRSPSEPGTYSLVYTVQDARGLPSRGTLVVEVAEDAPLEPPFAKDDAVPLEDAVLEQALDVPVLENDLDPDGDPAELELSVVTGPGEVVRGGIQVVPTEDFQVVTYRVTDQDGGTSDAFVFVPAVVDPAPRLLSTEPILVPSGERYEFPLADHVWVSTTNEPRITTRDAVSATHANGEELVVDEHTLQYTSELGYRGPAVLSLQVTDGPDAESGNVANLQIPIEVIASSQVPPTFSGVQLEVEAGGPAAPFDLTSATSDLDGQADIDGMRYEIAGGAVQGVDARIEDGQRFVATADRTAEPGRRGSYQVTVTDPAGNSVSGTVVVSVVSSTRELAEARPESIEMHQDEVRTVDVLTNDHNPFLRDGVPLRIVGVQAGQGGTATTDGSTVTVDPNDDFAGILTIQYTVQDGTQTTMREVVGTLTVTVKGAPNAPLRANADEVGDSMVRLSWQAPADNGARITHYLVQSTDGRVSQECPSTTCTITGLRNGDTYRFQVIAVNEVGESEPSPPTIEVRPDVKPDQPAPPVAERGDGYLDVSWREPNNRGTDITHYVLRISPPAPNGQVQVEVPSLSYRWEGLANGTAYSFSVQAVNGADEPSDFSALSAPVTPAGPPGAVASVSAQRLEGAGSAAQMRVTWGEADDNGAAITQFRVDAMQGGSVAGTMTVSGTERQATFEGTIQTSETAYTFRVTPVNDVGPGAANQSAAVRGVNPPSAPTAVSTVDGDRQVTVNFTPGARNGFRADEVRYEVRGGGAGTQVLAPGGAYTGMNNNDGPSTLEVRAVGTLDGQTYASAWTAASDQARPYGAIGAPTATATGRVGAVDFSWTAPARNGRDVTTQIRIDGGSWRNVANSGSESVTGRADSTHTIEVRSTTGAEESGHGAQTTTDSASAAVKPEPSATLSRGPDANNGCVDSNGQQCPVFQINWTNMPTGQYSFACHHDNDTSPGTQFESGTITVGAENGSTWRESSGELTCYSGYRGNAWVTMSGPGGSFETPHIRWP